MERVEGASGAFSGGLYNMELRGTGDVALVSHGPPVLIAIDGEGAFADLQAAITWSQGVKTDVNRKRLVDRGSGQTLQLAFARQRLAAAAPALRGRRGIAGRRHGRRRGRDRQSARRR
jgi:hypothetical protein